METRILKIMELALELKKRKTEVFVHYNPNADLLRLEVYEKGWATDKNANFETRIWLDWETTNDELDRVINILTAML
jgi:hypothetical protein